MPFKVGMNNQNASNMNDARFKILLLQDGNPAG
jgi:hypothetical protein